VSFSVGFVKKASVFKDVPKGAGFAGVRRELAEQIKSHRKYLKRHPGAPARDAAAFTGPLATDLVSFKVPRKGLPK